MSILELLICVVPFEPVPIFHEQTARYDTYVLGVNDNCISIRYRYNICEYERKLTRIKWWLAAQRPTHTSSTTGSDAVPGRDVCSVCINNPIVLVLQLLRHANHVNKSSRCCYLLGKNLFEI